MAKPKGSPRLVTYVRSAFAAVGATATIVFAIGGVGSILEKLDKSVESVSTLVQWWKTFWYPIPKALGFRGSDFSKDLIGIVLAELIVLWVASYLLHRRTLAFHFRDSILAWRLHVVPSIAPVRQQMFSLFDHLKGLSKAIFATNRPVRLRLWNATQLLTSTIGFALLALLVLFVVLTIAFARILIAPAIKTLILYPRTVLITLLLISVVMMANYFRLR